ncbi:putative carbamoyl-phosphate synthase (glutamine-hydrolyzing) [Helianthus annuus]|uniref:Carbamoyl-phosphate synthase (Glutamine-hydrolyzing) n=1 Tax=Helianthus annuus TaxID=4232 RepID=A0A9K3EM77_HELAN|nr:putative carbamoyl-phosphate synthase (glutamine-hydrolyzing) [Helianthus annuus]
MAEIILFANLINGSVEISAQNHNYAVEPESLSNGVEVTHVNLNDGSCVSLAFPQRKLWSLQYHPHPEASPGPHESDLGASFCFILLMIPITNLIFRHTNHYYFTNMQHFPSSVENAIDLFRNVYQCVCYYL